MDENIEEKLTEFKTLLKHEVENFRPEFELIFNNFLDSLAYKFKEVTDLFGYDSNKVLSDFILEKYDFIQGVSEFKNNTIQEISVLKIKAEQNLSSFEETKNQEIHQKIQNIEKSLNQKVELRLDKIAKDQSIFLESQNRIIQQQKTIIDNLNSQLDTLQRISEKDRREKTEAIENIEPKIKTAEEKIILAVNKRIEQMKQDVQKYVIEKTTKKWPFG